MTTAGYSATRRCPCNVIMPASGGRQLVPQPMNEALQAGRREAFFDVNFLPVDFATSSNQKRVDARDTASRGADALNVAIPSIERSTSQVIYDSQLTNPLGIYWGYYNSPAVDAQLRVVRNSFGTGTMNSAMG